LYNSGVPPPIYENTVFTIQIYCSALFQLDKAFLLFS
jgi:hypothetical protein